MQIMVYVTLGADDHLAYTPDQAAQQVLAALGGNPTKDYCNCTVTQPSATGEAGVVPPPTLPA